MNGAHALLPLELEPQSAPTCAKATASAVPIPTGIELEIGEAAASAAETVAVAMTEYEANGAMSPGTRAASAERLGKVAQLQLDTLGELPNFSVVVLAEGKRVLIARHSAVLHRHYGTIPETALEELLGYVIAIAAKVTNDELAFRAN